MQRGVSVDAKSGGREMMAAMRRRSGGKRKAADSEGPGLGGCETRAHALRGRPLMIETPF